MAINRSPRSPLVESIGLTIGVCILVGALVFTWRQFPRSSVFTGIPRSDQVDEPYRDAPSVTSDEVFVHATSVAIGSVEEPRVDPLLHPEEETVCDPERALCLFRGSRGFVLERSFLIEGTAYGLEGDIEWKVEDEGRTELAYGRIDLLGDRSQSSEPITIRGALLDTVHTSSGILILYQTVPEPLGQTHVIRTPVRFQTDDADVR